MYWIFLTTMGLPCTHNIQQLDNNQGLILDNIHKYWWIQGHFSVPQTDENAFSHENALQSRLQNLQKRYQEWPKFQQVTAHATLDEMINAPLMVLQNPNVVPTKGRSSGATNKRSTNSIRRDPSGFELVDQRVRKCTVCHQPGHKSHSCQLN